MRAGTQGDVAQVINVVTETNQGASSGCLLGCGAVTAALVGLSVYGFTSRNPSLGVPTAIFGALALAVLVWLVLSMQQAAAVECRVMVDPAQARFNETVTVRVEVLAKRAITLTTGTLHLRCQEKAISRGGTSDTTYTHLAHDEAHPIEAAAELGPGMAWQTSATFFLPEGLPASFSGANNFITWQAHLDLGLKGPLLDLHRDESFTVLPEVV